MNPNSSVQARLKANRAQLAKEKSVRVAIPELELIGTYRGVDSDTLKEIAELSDNPVEAAAAIITHTVVRLETVDGDVVPPWGVELANYLEIPNNTSDDVVATLMVWAGADLELLTHSAAVGKALGLHDMSDLDSRILENSDAATIQG